MNKLAFWKQKVIQAFHDPPAKPYAFFPGTGGHQNIAKSLFGHFTGEDFKYYSHRPDLAASGADRPVLSRPRGQPGQYGVVQFHRDSNDIVTHPLAPNAFLRLNNSSQAEPMKTEDIKALLEREEKILVSLGSSVAANGDPSDPVDWNDADKLEEGFWVLWRRFRDDLALSYPDERLLWERMPADSRIPDHSIWEHLKIASALAFMYPDRKELPSEKQPWLFSFALHPVQTFIEESRTSRDLWISSFLIAELTWSAMLPIVEQYGPDCIIYPDLRGNPRVDNWLYQNQRGALPTNFGYPITYAAVVPNTFTAILPGGGKDHLRRIDEIAADCSLRVQQRWQELAEQVQEWLIALTGTSGWQDIWQRQHRAMFQTYWTAVEWQVPPKVTEEEFSSLITGGALPAQDRTLLPPPSKEAQQKASRRRKRLSLWMPDDVWAHYERARSVFGRVNLAYVQNERGFDYSLTHHELRMRQRLLREEARHQVVAAEPAEKCTQCRAREALHDINGSADTIDGRRSRVREFWRVIWEKQEEPDRTDRLCAICAFKRFLVDACDRRGGINPVFIDPDSKQDVRVPFPSLSAVAAQSFLAQVAESNSSAVRKAIEEVTRLHKKTGLRRTLFFQTLSKLREASRKNPGITRFLEIDPQESIFPEAIQTLIDRASQAKKVDHEKRLRELCNAVENLRRAASEAGIEPPEKHVAVVRLDGDHMGRLLLGDAQRIKAVWRDVIHPKVVERLETTDELKKAGWPSLLNSARLMGPSLHAFISRALADFSHRVVPWIVEQEYGGSLIYAGGDDILAIAPARDALPMAARLQQLFSAAWIVDTHPEEQPWRWRLDKDLSTHAGELRQRFMIPRVVKPTKTATGIALNPIELPLNRDQVHLPIGVEEHKMPDSPINGEVLAGLGPYQSLSASIVYGHFKTQMSSLLREGKRLLNEMAKERGGRGAVALSHRSRGGAKSETVLPWNVASVASQEVLPAYDLVDRVVEAFRSKVVPARLPYKLRAVASSLLVEADAWPTKLARGLLLQALDRPLGDTDEPVLDSMLTLWRQGFELHVKPVLASDRSNERLRRATERSLDGLLLCRYLAGQGSEE